MSNFRSRALLDLAYELDCTLRIPGVCTGGTGEPAHANWAIWGKGGAMKAHDFAFASSCRACHRELDQGKNLTDFQREYYWTAAHAETMRQLWERGLLAVATGPKTLSDGATIASPSTLQKTRRKGSKRGTHTKTPDKCRIGWTKGESA